MLSRYFHFDALGTSLSTEITAGITTYLTMAYIIILQPMILSGRMFGFDTGLEYGAVLTATALSAAVATLIMGLYARYPVALAPGMGENFFFVFTLLPVAVTTAGERGWQVALGAVFLSGVLFLILSVTGVRRLLLQAISPGLRSGIGAGIGLFIAFIGLQNSGLIVTAASITPGPDPVLLPGSLVKLTSQLFTVDIFLFLTGLAITTGLLVRKVRGSMIMGIVIMFLIALLLRGLLWISPELAGQEFFQGSALVERFQLAGAVFSRPPSIAPIFLKFQLSDILTWSLLPYVLILLFMDLFDTTGTLIAVGKQAGLVRDGELPRVERAFLSDGIGTVTGAVMGTSTVTSYIESAAGVEQGGRSGFTAVVVAVLFLLSPFVAPVIEMLGSYTILTAPVLVVVGAMMMRQIQDVDFSDFSESVPAFLIILGIPLTYSIGHGIALGLLVYPFVRLLAGHGRRVTVSAWLIALLILAYFIFL